MIPLTTPDPMRLPDISLTAQGALAQTQLVTAENVLFVLEETGFSVRLNMMTAGVEYRHVTLDDRSPAVQAEMEMQILDMCSRLRMKSRDTVREILGVLAQRDPYHPMEDWLRGAPWDGRDRIAELGRTIVTSNPLWEDYLENWLVQVVEGVCGWRTVHERSLPYVLVLVGPQGVGKSRWLARLGGEWFKGEAELHLSSSSGKDHQLEVLRWPIAELAELDGIFRKADMSHMKAFISRGLDTLRAPYERRALVRPRMTTMAGSVNDAEFLSDGTGSRRFWPVLVESIQWNFTMDWRQLWAQAYSYWQQDSGFGLTAEQDALREELALRTHTLFSSEHEMITEYYRRHAGNPKFQMELMNRTEILQMLLGKNVRLSNKQISDAGRTISDICGPHQTIEGKQRCWRFPFNEFATDPGTWPQKYHLTVVS